MALGARTAAPGGTGRGAGARPPRVAAGGGRAAGGGARPELVRQVRDALAHLYDLPYLQTHPLTGRLAPAARGRAAGQALQRELLSALEALRPEDGRAGAGAGRGGPAARRHRLLALRYVEALAVAEVQRRLALSPSAYFREHQRALAAVVSLLGERWGLGEDGAGEFRGPTNLPLQLTSFVGRARELAAVTGALAAARLVTLTGAGGCGKTRLALQVAAGLSDAYPDGVWLVELAPLADPALVPGAVAGAVGVPEQPGRPLHETLEHALRPKALLLVLDNCEHLLDACATLLEALLRGAPDVRVLATSREPLRVAGEAVWRVPPLETPAAGEAAAAVLAGNEAVRLFVERARATRPEFALRPENARTVADLCRRLDGVPLALELAAARVRVLPVGDVLERLADRFRLLTEGSRTALPRQQTLAATVDWSYELLTEAEQTVFRRLAVFAGGWSLRAAEQIVADPVDAAGDRSLAPAGEILDLLTRLVDRSLVVAEEDSEGHARFRLLETLRAYARARLEASGEASAVHRRHLVWFTGLAEEAERELEGADQGRWLARLEREHDNCRTALRWALDRPEPDAVEDGLRLAAALPWFCLLRGHLHEARTWLDALLAVSTTRTAPATRARALGWAGVVAGLLGDTAAGRTRREECAALARTLGDPRVLGRTLRLLGHMAMSYGSPGEAAAWLTQNEALFRQADDQPGRAFTLYWLGRLARQEGDCDAAQRAYEASLAIYRRLGNRDRVAAVLHGLGITRRAAGDAAGSRPLHEEALAIWRELGYENGIAGALNSLGEVALAAGDRDRAETHFTDALERFRAVESRLGEAIVRRNLALGAHAAGDRPAARTHLRAALSAWRGIGRDIRAEHRLAETLELLAGLAADDGQAAAALRLAGTAAAVRDGAGRRLAAAGRADLERRLAPAQQALDPETAAAAFAHGRTMSLDQAIDEALSGEDPDATDVAAVAAPRSAAAPAFEAAQTVAGAPAHVETPSSGGPLRVDSDTYTVWRGPRPLPRPLAAKEFALVRYLCERAGRVCTRRELGDAIWGPDGWDPAMLYRLVRRAREKLEPRPERPRYLRSAPGFGYCLSP